MAKSLVLITVDCLRADHLGFLGYRRNTTPFLDTLAASSTMFSNAIVAGAPTYYSFPAIMASRHPLALGRDVIGIAPEEPTIASVLSQSGYATAAFLAANPYLSSRFGYDAGFDTFHDFLDAPTVSSAENANSLLDSSLLSRFNSVLAKSRHFLGPIGWFYDDLYFRYCQIAAGSSGDSLDTLRRFPSADVIVKEASAWLKKIGPGPFFLWLHFMDPHSPYYPKKEALKWMTGDEDAARARYANSYWNRADIGPSRLRTRRDEVIALYDAGIRWADFQISCLVNELRQRKLWDDCLFVVTADHGEEFLEHGGRYHSPSKVTEELIHVPLLLHGSKAGEPQVHSDPFSLIDLAPTVLDDLDISAPATFRGRSRWAKGATQASPPAIVECVERCNNPFSPEQRMGPRILAIRESEFKWVFDFASSEENLFNLASDPSEQHPLPSDAEKTVRRRFLEFARQHIGESVRLRDDGQRLDSKLRGFRLECADPQVRISA